MKQVFTKETETFSVTGKLSDDRQKLFIDVEPLAKGAISHQQLESVLKEAAPGADLHQGVLDDIVRCLNNGEKVKERRVAKGVPPEDGADGKVLFLIKKMSADAELKVDERGYADYTEIHLFDNVTKGQIVGRVYPPKLGTSGKDALGGTLPPKPGKPIKLSIDKTVILNPPGAGDDFETLVADENGFLTDQDGKVAIKTELVIKNDLDYRYGSIDFIGAVKVTGDVLPGFNIKAQGGIEVSGSVRGGSLICPNGDIVVKGYVYGGHNSRIICGKSFTATVVQEINAEIIGNITILKESLNSNLRTESSLFVPGGQLVGGNCFAVCGVEAKYLGNEAFQPTTIYLCSDIETHTEFTKLSAMIESYEQAKKLLEVHLGPYAKNPERVQLLKSPYKEKVSRLWSKLQEVEQARERLLQKKKVMLESAKTNDVLRVNYLSKCYEGVIVKAGDQEFTPKEILQGPGSIDYIVNENKFSTGELKPLQCSIHPESQGSEQNTGGKQAAASKPPNDKGKGDGPK